MADSVEAEMMLDRPARKSVVRAAEQNETLVTLFLSGRPSRTVAPVELEHLSAEEEEEAQHENFLIDEAGVEYFPDPPCIAPMEEDDDFQPATKKSKGISVQAYWKSFATWQQDDPDLAGARALGLRFVEQWTDWQRSSGCGPRRGTARSMSTSRSSSSGEVNVVSEAFVNISPHSLGVRRSPSTDDAERSDGIVRSGQCVLVDKVVEDEVTHIRYLRLADGSGWVFDTKGGDRKETLMAKMEDVDVGLSWHRVVCKELVDVRRAPVYDAEARTARLLGPKEMFVVNVKCRVRNAPFVHLADGRGWVFVKKPGTDKKARTWKDLVVEECDAELVEGSKFRDLGSILPATNDAVEVGVWTYVVGHANVLALGAAVHGTFIPAGDIVKVDKRAYADGDAPEDGDGAALWLRLADGRGWVPQRTVDGTELLTERKESSMSYPAHFRGHAEARNLDRPAAAWMVGVA